MRSSFSLASVLTVVLATGAVASCRRHARPNDAYLDPRASFEGDDRRIFLGTDASLGLPLASIDLAFLCDVYHHFDRPKEMLASLRRALHNGFSRRELARQLRRDLQARRDALALSLQLVGTLPHASCTPCGAGAV